MGNGLQTLNTDRETLNAEVNPFTVGRSTFFGRGLLAEAWLPEMRAFDDDTGSEPGQAR